MRRLRKRFGEDDSAVDMTPMLDIVFIMLIFFIVTATFLDERAIDLTQPPPPPDDQQNNSPSKPGITVYVNEQNFCAVDSRSTDCGDVPVAVEGLLSDKPGAAIILRIHEAAKHEILVNLKDVFDEKNMSPRIEIIRS